MAVHLRVEHLYAIWLWCLLAQCSIGNQHAGGGGGGGGGAHMHMTTINKISILFLNLEVRCMSSSLSR